MYIQSRVKPRARHYAIGIVYRYRKLRSCATKGKCIVHNLLFERETIAEISPAAARHPAVFEETFFFEKSDQKILFKLIKLIKFYDDVLDCEKFAISLIRIIQIISSLINFHIFYLDKLEISSFYPITI